MKNMRALAMLTVATIAALAAVLFASRWMLTQTTPSTKVAVATTDINLGQRLTPEFVKLVDWPAGSIPAGTFSDPQKLDGRVLKTSAQRGEPILDAKLAPVGTLGGLSAVIGEGKRAITVRVNDVIGVAGFALPGNYVDIIVNTQKDGSGAQSDPHDRNISKIVLEKILVLAIAQEVGRDDTKPRVVNAVTLEVTPDQAERIDLARSVGTLSLVLRNQVDTKDEKTGGATKVTLLKEPVPVVVAPKTEVKTVRVVQRVVAKPSGDCIGVISGTQSRQECF
jgi:pilus assembly protein CpaB